MEIKDMDVGALVPYENNPRSNDAAVDYVANSIKEFGFKVPIVIDQNNIVIAGHTRLKAAVRLGLETVPCIVADDLTEEQISAFRLADNKVSEKASWDFDKLQEELDLLQFDFDMADFGFDDNKEESGGTDEGNFGESDFTYQSQYGVTVILENEAEQEDCYNKLVGMGYKCKVVTV